ncbi:hypothetical protein AKJ36_00050 [candidate division MSBL1 archaeon SCGC-AAA259I07]|uniref:Primase C-terminal 1 domain-containing protein n=1 Tax=candidate division MSBL1 archaeon SCGC-AAA259I07 TaxID=1698266 RepID=A0A133UMV8_9EURY|nr:hypothetical protein AKJ36_00050 [candidate division MSBL1 archaeon SCGC-AAA259I07]
MYFDIDNPDLDEAMKSTLNLAEHLSERIPERHLSIYFSGNKGFHLQFPSNVFDLKDRLPDEKVSYAYKNYAKRLKEEHAPDIDLAVYEPKRLWRIVNSKHEESGLYKVPVTVSELEVLSAEEIRELAEKPRKDIYAERNGATPVLEMAELYEELREQEPQDSIVKAENLDGTRPRRVTEPIIDEKTPCIESLLSGVDKGERNESAIRLASAFRNFGYSEKRALNELESWNSKNNPPLPGHEVRNTLRSAYRNQYNYGCKDHLLEKYCDKDECEILEEERISKCSA